MIRCGGEWSPRRNNVAEGGITYYKIIARTIRRFLVFVVRPNDRLSLSSPSCMCSYGAAAAAAPSSSSSSSTTYFTQSPNTLTVCVYYCYPCTLCYAPHVRLYGCLSGWLAGWLALAGMGNAPHMHTEANESSLPPNQRSMVSVRNHNPPARGTSTVGMWICRHNNNNSNVEQVLLRIVFVDIYEHRYEFVCVSYLCFRGEINQVSCLQLLHKAVDGIVTIHERESNSHVVKCSSTPRESVH